MLYQILNPLTIKKPIYDKNDGYKVIRNDEIENKAIINDNIDGVNIVIGIGFSAKLHESHASILIKKYPFLISEIFIEPIVEKEEIIEPKEEISEKKPKKKKYEYK
jgi:hypothetical protein